jgi:hypothetical protein
MPVMPEKTNAVQKKRNVLGATAKEVIGHKGNMLELEDGTLLHVAKAVRPEGKRQ